jgi:hypothetical protein
MSNLQPLFASAPRIKLYINNQVVAYAIGFNFNVSVDVQPVFVLGRFAPVSLEPTMYNTVTGTIQIVRLKSKNAVESLLASAKALHGADMSIPITTGDTTKAESIITNSAAGAQANNTPIGQSELFRHVTPSQLLLSQAFGMQLYMRMPNEPLVIAEGTPTAEKTILTQAYKQLKEVPWMNIQNCRITSRNTNISMGALVNEPLNFQGLLATHSIQGTDITKEYDLDRVVKQT